MPEKLKEREFYCVACRKRVMSNPKDICLTSYKTSTRKVNALKGYCSKSKTNLTKFISEDAKVKLSKKYKKC
jgi:hypothetical protein